MNDERGRGPVEVPLRRTPWTPEGLAGSYGRAWRALEGTDAPRVAVALLCAQATLECAHGAACYGHTPGNVMGAAPGSGHYHVLRAPECGDPARLPPGATLLDPAKTSIRCGPGKVPYMPRDGSKFRSYESLDAGCRDKLALLAARWPRAVAVLRTASSAEDAGAYAAALTTPARYFTADVATYTRTIRALAGPFLTLLDPARTTPAAAPVAELADWQEVQRALAARGHDPGPIDGIPGPRTVAAVRAFQAAAGLRVDGIVGPATRAALARV